jgi:hypothetical protein
MPEPECYMPGWLTLRRDSDLELLLEELRPLMLNGVIQNQPMIINATCAISAFTGREQWYTGAGALPEDVIEHIAASPGLGRWVMRFALYGDERIVERQREIGLRRHGSGARLADTQRHRLLQGAVVEGRVVSRPLLARWGRGQPRGNVRPGPPARRSRARRFHAAPARTAAIPGHEYGLDLTIEERAQLIAFLRTL